MIKSKIIATGSYLPEKIVSNDDLSKIVDTNDEWILTRTGIKNRHIADDKELTSDLAYKAALDLLKSSNFDLTKIDCIILATTTPDLTFPATAVIVQEKLGIKNAFAFDVQAVCSGFVYALDVADSFIKSGKAKNILVIGAETLSRIVDWKDRNSCVLFGDGAGAVILSAQENDCASDILASNLYSDGALVDILKTSGGTSSTKDSGFITMQGREVFKNAVEKMSNSLLSTLKKANLTIEDLDWLIPHQANLRILTSLAQKVGISKEKVIITLQNQGNSSAATIPLAMDYANKNGKLVRGNNVAIEALGGGLTWGSIILRW
jgi:3-oxoacyl-[acyl-carrier-protein] synthase-3